MGRRAPVYVFCLLAGATLENPFGFLGKCFAESGIGLFTEKAKEESAGKANIYIINAIAIKDGIVL